MEIEFKTVVKLTENEAQKIRGARDLLCDYEAQSDVEQQRTLVELFEDKMGYEDVDYSTLSITIDFLTFLLRLSGDEKEED